MSRWTKINQQNYDFEALEKELTEPKVLPHMKKSHVMENGEWVTLYNGKKVEEFTVEDTIAFYIDTDLLAHGKVMPDLEEAIKKAGYQYSFEGVKINVTPIKQANISNPETKTYLNLPHLNNDDFKKLVSELKENGAQFDEKVKRWYITQDVEPSKFDKYIGFSSEVDSVLNGTFPHYSAIKVCDTPQILIDVGCRQLPMLYTQKHMKDAIKPIDKKEHQHGLSVEQIKMLPKILQEPVMILDSQQRKDSIIVVTSERDPNENPVLISIKPNGQGRYELEKIEANFLTSVYGRNNFGEFIANSIRNDNVLFCDNKKSQVLFERWGEQYSELTNNLDFNTIIHKSRNISNLESEKKEEKNSSLSSNAKPEEHELSIEEEKKRIAKAINQNPKYKANRPLVENIYALNKLVGKEHTVIDLSKAYKAGTYKDNPEADKLMKDIGKEFIRQEQMRAIAQ